MGLPAVILPMVHPSDAAALTADNSSIVIGRSHYCGGRRRISVRRADGENIIQVTLWHQRPQLC